MKMDSWSEDEVLQFLLEKKVDEELANDLKKKKINGMALKRIGGDQTISVMHSILGIQPGELLSIHCIVKSYLESEEGEQSISKKIFRNQIARSFRQQPGDLVYTEGACLPNECSSSDLIPAREFKAGQYPFKNIRELERFFIERIAKFACACINRRCNGTIYFGVGDSQEVDESKPDKRKYRHGQILGMDLPTDIDLGTINAWLEKHFRATKPKLASRFSNKSPEVAKIRECFSNCLLPATLIPLNGSQKVVIEVDIEPKHIWCNYLMIYFLDYENKKRYYLREGEKSNEYTQNLEELYKKVSENSNRRASLEHDEDRKSENAYVKLSCILCRNQIHLDDSKFKYVLMINQTSAESNETISRWLALINWIAIWNFDSNYSEKDSLFNHLIQAKEFLRQVTMVLPDDDDKHQNDQIWKSKKLNWIQCVLPRSPRKEWVFNERKFLQAIANQLIASHETRLFVFVITLFSIESLIEISDIFIDMCTKIQNNNQTCIVYTEKRIYDSFCSKVQEKIPNLENYSVQLKDWTELEIFLNSKTTRSQSNNEFLVPNSSGIGKQVKLQVIQAYEHYGVEILGMNHCQGIEFDNSKSMEFLRGGGPTWEIFHFHDNASTMPTNMIDPLVQRTYTEDIKKQIENTTGKNVLTKVHKFVHQPGSGATTIAMNVLWNLRSSFRCVRIDNLDTNNISEIAETIIAFYLLDEKEDDGKLCRIVILLDNSSDEKALKLKRELETKAGLNNLKFRRALFTLLYLVRQPDLSLPPKTKEYDSLLEEPSFTLMQEHPTKDKINFQKKLGELVQNFKGGEIPLPNMLAFVIMAENFNKHSSYVKKIVNDALEDIELYGNQKDLLIYLAIMKYYGDKGLPSSNCHSFIDELGYANKKNTTSLMDSLSIPTKFFVVEKLTDESHSVLEISHEPVAYQLLEKFTNFSTKKEKLQNKIKDLLEEKSFMSKRFLKIPVHSSIRDVLVKRNTMEDGMTRPQFSRLIEDLRKDSLDIAIKLLELAFKKLDESQIHYIAQTLSRLFIRSKEHEKAIHWATIAIQLRDFFTFYDTRGQALKYKLKDMLEGESVDISDAVAAAEKAAENFQQAENIFQDQKKIQEATLLYEFHSGFDMFSSVTAIMPALFGEIEVNIKILIFLCARLDNDNIRQSFLQSLSDGSKIDWKNLFQGTHFSKESFEYMKSLKHRTNECISQATNLMNYQMDASWADDYSTRMEKQLYKLIERFDKLVGPQNADWRKIVDDKRMKPKAKIRSLLEYVRITTTQSFIFLVRNVPESIIKDKLRITDEVYNQLKECPEAKLLNTEKLCCVRLALANLLKHLFHSKSDPITSNRLEELENRVILYCKELCLDGFKNSEPYLFYLMLTWPFMDDDGEHLNRSPHFDEDIFQLCIRKLEDFEENVWRSCWTGEFNPRLKKPQVQFFLKKLSRESTFGVRRLIHKRQREVVRKSPSEFSGCYRATGMLATTKQVTYTLPSGDEVKIRKAYLGFEEITLANDEPWESMSLHKVTYNIGFTFGGPLAYNVQVLQESMIDKVRHLQSDS